MDSVTPQTYSSAPKSGVSDKADFTIFKIAQAAGALDIEAMKVDGTYDSTFQASLNLINIIKDICANGTPEAQTMGLRTLINKSQNPDLPEVIRENLASTFTELINQYVCSPLLLSSEDRKAAEAIDASLGNKIKIIQEEMHSIPLQPTKPTGPGEHHMRITSTAVVSDASHNGMLHFLNEKLSY
jgi:hypothetical protein